ncbi:hypothetical protein CLV24_103166 [Pontibacter ummariensis]|uniref:DUF962 domain-containing protein n=1 Tax=Pontibacter ummariensis TaxID=1610492 RepID=A0A239CN92_9BACT|nr:DUF962 domain-containing protein [Pontibacter ummariensis]PRY14927.1 hypothetical protein CLV24_103166 [Pontibacter ummariensis]SNS21409.1 hypothetical protein SAMN06296052_103147 [Pontibacter ummariensis]
MGTTAEAKEYTSLKEFYPYYLSEHQNTTCRVLHFVGTGLLLMLAIVAVVLGKYAWLLFVPVIGYGFAWVGHFFFEHNKPATFRYPFYSLASDLKLFFDILRRKQGFRSESKA